MNIARLGGACFVALVGCSSSGSTTGGGASATPSEFAQSFCAYLAPCCAKAGLSTSGEECESLLTVAAGQGTYSASAGAACLAQVHAAASGSTFCAEVTMSGTSTQFSSCSSVFGSGSSGGGTTPPGQPCMTSDSCASASGAGGGALCIGSAVETDGGGFMTTEVCVQTLPGSAGQGPCVGTVNGSTTTYGSTGSSGPPSLGYLCQGADGLTCNDATQKCTPLASTGQSCSGDQDCVAADYCNFGATGAGSLCAVRLSTGASCAEAPSGCATTAYCDPGTQVCTASLADGAACTSSEQCQSDSCVNSVCGGSSTSGLALICGN